MTTSATTDFDNIGWRVPDGFYQTSSATMAEGWPENTGSWAHLLSVTHNNDTNYYAMQFAGGFFDNDHFYVRKTSGYGLQPWRELIHSANSSNDGDRLRYYGFVGDGNSRQLASVTSCAGYNTAGWSLGQWQSIFPKAQSVSDEIDGCAIQKVWDINTRAGSSPDHSRRR